jgi:hypothetical protein
MDEETQKDTRQGCERRTMHHLTINQMELKTEDPKKQTSAKKQVSQEYPKANYQVDIRTVRTLYSHHIVSRSEDMGGHTVTSMRRRVDKYETRSANGRAAQLRCILAN